MNRDFLDETLFNSLNVLCLTKEQKNKIIKSEFRNGLRIFDEESIMFFYDLCGYIKQYGIETVLKYVTYLETLDEWNEYLRFTDPYKSLDDVINMDVKKLEDKILPSLKGLYKCPKCDSKNVYEVQIPTRADEESRTKVICVACKHKIR